MSMRGVKFQFQSGEPVLCFEPDDTKARVLYNAKILELIVGHGSDGTRQPDYLVHFQGWNSSWDRVVSESLIISNSEENRQLMKLLATTARKIKTNHQRKRKIEALLSKHFSGDQDQEGELTDETDESTKETDTDLDSEKKSMPSTDDDDTDFSDNEISFKDKSLVNLFEEKDILQEEEIVPREVTLDLPERLKRILEDDCYYICRNNKLVELPAKPNILTILEGYVKNFTADLVYTTQEKRSGRREKEQKVKYLKNIELIKEVVDGLRLLFDFSLAPILLYSVEKDQHKNVIKHFTHRKENLKSEQPDEKPDISETEVHSPRLRSATTKGLNSPMSTAAGTTNAPCSSPTVTSTCPSPRALRPSPRSGGSVSISLKREPLDENNILPDDDSTPHRRLTRNKYSDVARKRALTGETDSPVKEKVAKTDIKTSSNNNVVIADEAASSSHDSRRESLRSGHKHTAVSNNEGSSQQQGGRTSSGGDVKNTTLKDRVVPPPPLNVTNTAASSKDSTSSQNTPNHVSDSSSSMVYCNGYKTKEAAMNHIFGWNLVPEEVYEMTPAPPSVVYGAHHLLRLFVKLPEILSKMAIPDKKFNILLEHMRMFIEYLSERNEELFSDSVYIANTYYK